MDRIVIFPAFNVGDSELLYSLKSIDQKDILVICNADFIDRNKPSGNFIPDDFSDSHALSAKIKGWLRKNKKIAAGIIGVDEEDQFSLTSSIAESLGISFYGTETLNIASNKYLMKNGFEKNNVPTPKFQLIESGGKASIGYPNVMKIVSGNSSEFLFFNNTKAELDANLRTMARLVKDRVDTRLARITLHQGIRIDPRKAFLLEEFAIGTEFSCDFLIDRGVQILRIVRKIRSSYFGYFSAFHLINDSTAADLGINLSKLKEIGQGIAGTLKIERGVCMCDFIVSNGRITVLETNIRPGIATFIHAMHEMYGYSSLSALVRLMLGEHPDIRRPAKEGLVVQVYAKPGVLKEFSFNFPDSIKEKIIATYRYFEPGDNIEDSETNHHGLLAGYAVVADVRPDEIEKTAIKIEDSTKIITE